MGYGHPRTLSETSMKNCKGDILELKPTLLVGVPSVWETVKKGVIANVNKGGPVVRSLFWSAFYSKRLLSSTGLPGSGILDAVVFNKVKQATGGRLRFCLNGAGPISQQTQEFISHTITPMISGYGSTETTALVAPIHLYFKIKHTDNKSAWAQFATPFPLPSKLAISPLVSK